MRHATLTALIALVAAPAAAQTFDFTTPTDDRWQYPFNSQPATRPLASTFSSLGTGVPSFRNFNDHDGIFIIAWDTSALIDPNQGLANYNVLSVTVTLINESNANWKVDLTPDEWFTVDVNNDTLINGDGIPRGQPGDIDGESDDPDPGRTVELYGAGFGPTYSYATWVETSLYKGGTNVSTAPRDPFPINYFDPNGALIHIEDNVQGRWNGHLGITTFTPTPWAVGVPEGYDPNNQTTTFPVTFDVDLDLFGGRAREYFQQQLDGGRVVVMIASLADTVQGGVGGDVPSFFTKEGVGLEPGALAPKLTITLGAAQQEGDVNGDGCVDLTDLAILLANFDATPAIREQGDLNGDDTVDLTDLAILLAHFDEGTC